MLCFLNILKNWSDLFTVGARAATISGTGKGYSRTGGYIKPKFTSDLPPKGNWSQGRRK